MLPIRLRRLLGNIAGGFFYNHDKRIRARVIVSAPMWRCVRFVKRIHGKHAKIEKFYGAGGKSLVLGVDKKYVYKFSCMRNANYIATRERDILEYFGPISTLPTPRVKLLKMGREIVRRYDYVAGASLASIDSNVIIKNANKIGKQIAKFLFEIGKHDPDELRKYKNHPIDIPRPFYGWNHKDWDNLENFIVDAKTLKIIAIIDWENAMYGDFYYRLHRTNNQPIRALMDAVEREYWRLWNSAEK